MTKKEQTKSKKETKSTTKKPEPNKETKSKSKVSFNEFKNSLMKYRGSVSNYLKTKSKSDVVLEFNTSRTTKSLDDKECRDLYNSLYG